MRQLIVHALRGDGYSLLEATDGGRLLVSLGVQFQNGDQDLDLIISDIRMPVCSGLDILEAVRSAHWTIPVILMTAFGDDDTRRRTEALGAVLLDKPFALDDLRVLVTKLLRFE